MKDAPMFAVEGGLTLWAGTITARARAAPEDAGLKSAIVAAPIAAALVIAAGTTTHRRRTVGLDGILACTLYLQGVLDGDSTCRRLGRGCKTEKRPGV